MIKKRPVTRPRRRAVLEERPEPTDKKSGPERNTGFDIPEDVRNQVIAMATAGLGIENIAHLVKLDAETLRRSCAFEIAHGSSLSTGRVSGRLFRIATEATGKEAVDAAKFWLTHKGGWKPTQVMEHVGANGEPISISAEVRTITDEERAIRTLQLLNLFSTRGVGPASTDGE